MALNDIIKKFGAGLILTGATMLPSSLFAKETPVKLDNPNTYEQKENKKENKTEEDPFSPFAMYGQLRHVQNDFDPLNNTSDATLRFVYRPSRTDRLFFDTSAIFAHGENEQGKRLDTLASSHAISYGKYFSVGTSGNGQNNSWIFTRFGGNYSNEFHQGLMDTNVHLFGGEMQIGLYVPETIKTDLRAKMQFGSYAGNVSGFKVSGNTNIVDLKWDMRVFTPLKQLAAEAGAQFTNRNYEGDLKFNTTSYSLGTGLAISPVTEVLLRPGAYWTHTTTTSGATQHKDAFGIQVLVTCFPHDNINIGGGYAYDTQSGHQAMAKIGFTFK